MGIHIFNGGTFQSTFSEITLLNQRWRSATERFSVTADRITENISWEEEAIEQTCFLTEYVNVDWDFRLFRFRRKPPCQNSFGFSFCPLVSIPHGTQLPCSPWNQVSKRWQGPPDMRASSVHLLFELQSETVAAVQWLMSIGWHSFKINHWNAHSVPTRASCSCW